MSGSLLQTVPRTLAIVFVEGALKSFALLVATTLFAWLLRNKSAATVHRLWTLSFCGLIIVPSVAPLLPTWSLTILPNAWFSGSVEVRPTESPVADSASSAPLTLPLSGFDGASQTVDQFPVPAPQSSHGPQLSDPIPVLRTPAMSDGSNAGSIARNSASFDQRPGRGSSSSLVYLTIAWTIGVVVCVTRILIDQIRTSRIVRNAVRIQDGSWDEVRLSVAGELRVNQQIELLRVDLAVSPMICGIMRQKIILPAESLGWDMERRRLVLLHEMAHSQRRDVAIQLLAQLVCAIYWFNPLAWVGLAQMRKLRELACDDMVLQSGQRPSDYASVLLHFAKACRHRTLITAVGMARKNDMETRIMALLDGVRSHVSLSRRSASNLLGMTVVIVGLVGSMRLQSQAQQSSTDRNVVQTPVERKDDDTRTAESPTSELRTMTVNVRDEKGEPLAQTSVRVNVLESNDSHTIKPTLNYVTADDGSVEIKLPQHFFHLQLWASRPRHVTMYTDFQDETQGVNNGNKDISSAVAPTFDFVLRPATRFSGKVVDEKGRPISGVKIRTHSRPALRLGASTKPKARQLDPFDFVETDQNGVWIVEEGCAKGPEMTVRLETQHPDFVADSDFESTREVSLLTAALINGSSQIVMKHRVDVAGTVTDATSGAAVANFRVIPVIVFRPDWLHTDFINERTGVDGRYEISKLFNVGDGRRHHIRIEANGYRTAISKTSFGPGELPSRIDFQLEPAVALAGRILDPKGMPVSGGSVIVASPTVTPRIYNNKLENPFANRPDRSITPDDQGQFEIAATFEPIKLRVIHESGFAEISRKLDARPGSIRLLPWAKVTGTLRQGGNPIANQRISFHTMWQQDPRVPRFSDSYFAMTDANGAYEFARLPPMAGSLGVVLSPKRSSPLQPQEVREESSLTSSQWVAVVLEPGETRTVSFGDEGIDVKGQIVLSGGDNHRIHAYRSENYLIRRQEGLQPPVGFPWSEFDPRSSNRSVRSLWKSGLNFWEWMAARDHYFVNPSPSGKILLQGVTKGEYDLILELYDDNGNELVSALGRRVVPVTVTEADLAAGEKDLGRLEIQCLSHPKIGDQFKDLHWQDLEGTVHDLRSAQRDFVLLHVWSGWSGPCKEDIITMSKFINSTENRKIEWIGINIDADPAAGKSFVADNQLDWKQTYAGPDSEIVKLFAVSTAPRYFLIDREGKLVESSTSWSAMQSTVMALNDE